MNFLIVTIFHATTDHTTKIIKPNEIKYYEFIVVIINKTLVEKHSFPNATKYTLWAHPHIRPCFQLYAGCAPLALPPTHDFVPYNFFSLAVLPGPHSGLSLRPLLHCLRNSGSSLSPALLSGVFFSSLLLTQQPSRIAPSQLLVPRSGMGYL